jgi:hypothetical protein
MLICLPINKVSRLVLEMFSLFNVINHFVYIFSVPINYVSLFSSVRLAFSGRHTSRTKLSSGSLLELIFCCTICCKRFQYYCLEVL